MFLLLLVAVFLVLSLLAMSIIIGVTLTSLITLVTAPSQLFRLLRNRQLRRNHALEHATINIIEERFGRSQLAGLARPDGFLIFGTVSPALVLEAAREGLRRLQQGERRLAIHPRCGTTLVAGQLVLAITFLGALLLLRQLSLWPFILGILAAMLVGPRLSPFLQRWVTTDAQVEGLIIEGLQPHVVAVPLPWTRILTPVPRILLVRTRSLNEATVGHTFTILTHDARSINAGSYRVD